MDLKTIDFEEATKIYKTNFIGEAASFFANNNPGIYPIGDMLWDDFGGAEFLLGYEDDKPLAMAIYTGTTSKSDSSGLAIVELHAILTKPIDEQRGSHFVNLLFQLRVRFQQAKGEYFKTEAAPYDDFTVEMLEATEFKLIAPFAQMRISGGEIEPNYRVEKANSFDMTIDSSEILPGADPLLGETPAFLAATTFEIGVGAGITYNVNRSNELLGYLCVVPDTTASMLFGEPYGKLLYAHPWDTFELYEAAAQIEVYKGITIYAPLTEPLLVQSLENTGYRTIGAKLSFRLSLL